MTDPAIRELARRLSALESQVGKRGGQLAYSALEDGAIREFDLEGTQVAQYGTQYDGTHVAASLVGPPPPQPSAPTVQGVAGGFLVAWDGTWSGGAFVVAPMDWLRTDVVYGAAGFNPIATPPTMAIVSPRGGIAFIPAEPGDYEVALVARSQSGAASPASDIVTVTALAAADAAQVTAAQDAADQAIADALAASIAAAGASTAAGNASTAAGAADAKATQALLDAAAAASLAGLAQSAANAAITVFRQSTAPASGMGANDLWIDSDDGLLYVYVGSTWTLSADQRVATVVASNATKTTVFAQTSQPSTSGRTIGDLWIDTDDGNRLYDWSGSWTARALGAAAISATARQLGSITIFRQSAAPTGAGAFVIGDLWLDIDDGLLYSASSTSGAWILHSDQRIATVVASNAVKVTAFSQTTAPTSTGRVLGDIWVDTDDSNKIYIWDGAWTVRLMGAGAISATARQLGAVNIYRQSTAPASGMANNDLWIDSDDGLVYVYTGTWTLSADQRVGALVTSNATKVTAFWQTSPPSTTDRAIGDLWFDTDDGNKVYNWTGAWTPQVYGDSAIGGVGAGKILTGSISAGQEVIAGNALGNHAKMTDTGFKVLVDDPVDFVPNEVVRMGSSTGDLFAITDAGGHVRASISELGQGAFTGMSIDPTVVDAEDNPVEGLTIYGKEFLEWLDRFPRGVVAWENFGTDKGPTGAAELGYGEIGFRAEVGRLYRINYRAGYDHTTAGAGVQFKLRLTHAIAPAAAASPTVSSSIILTSVPMRHTVANSDYTVSDYAYVYNETGVERNVRILLTFAGQGTAAGGYVRAFGTGASTLAAPESGVVMTVEDVGPVRAQGGAYNTGGAAVTPVQTYTSTWNATNSMGYTGSNVADNDADFKQGYSSADGDSHGCVVFGGNAASGEKTKTIAQAMTGATLKKAEVYLYANHWYYNSGGTALIRAYNSTSLSSATPSGTVKSSSGWPKPGGRWVDITSIATTSIRGITVGKAGSTNLLYYGRFNGHTLSSKPQLRLTYTR